MGYKGVGIFVGDLQHSFGENPVFNEAKRAAILSIFECSNEKRDHVLEQLIRAKYFKQPGAYAIGAFDHGMFFSSHELLRFGGGTGDQLKELHPKMEKLQDVYPGCDALFWFVLDITNAYTYVYYRKGQLTRALSVAEDITFDHGELLSEDLRFLEHNSRGETVARQTSDDFDESDCELSTMVGEAVLAMTERFLGQQVDQFDGSLFVQVQNSLV